MILECGDLARTAVVALPPGERWTVVASGTGLVAEPSEFVPPCNVEVRRAPVRAVPLRFRLVHPDLGSAPVLRPQLTVITPSGTTVPRRTVVFRRADDGAYTASCEVDAAAGVLRVEWESAGIQAGTTAITVPTDGSPPDGAPIEVHVFDIAALPLAARVLVTAADGADLGADPVPVFTEERLVGSVTPGKVTVVDAPSGAWLVARRDTLVSAPVRAETGAVTALPVVTGGFVRIRWRGRAGWGRGRLTVARADRSPVFVRGTAEPMTVLDFDEDVRVGPFPPGSVGFVTVRSAGVVGSWSAEVAADETRLVVVGGAAGSGQGPR